MYCIWINMCMIFIWTGVQLHIYMGAARHSLTAATKNAAKTTKKAANHTGHGMQWHRKALHDTMRSIDGIQVLSLQIGGRYEHQCSFGSTFTSYSNALTGVQTAARAQSARS